MIGRKYAIDWWDNLTAGDWSYRSPHTSEVSSVKWASFLCEAQNSVRRCDACADLGVRLTVSQETEIWEDGFDRMDLIGEGGERGGFDCVDAGVSVWGFDDGSLPSRRVLRHVTAPPLCVLLTLLHITFFWFERWVSESLLLFPSSISSSSEWISQSLPCTARRSKSTFPVDFESSSTTGCEL